MLHLYSPSLALLSISAMKGKGPSLPLQPTAFSGHASDPRQGLRTSTSAAKRLTTLLLSLLLLFGFYCSNSKEVSIGSIGSTLKWWKYQLTPLPKDPLERARKFLIIGEYGSTSSPLLPQLKAISVQICISTCQFSHESSTQTRCVRASSNACCSCVIVQ